MSEIERLEKELQLAETRLRTEQVSYRMAKLKLKEEMVKAGILKVDDATARICGELRDKADCFKSIICKHVLRGLADALECKGGTELLDLDDELYRRQNATLRVGVWHEAHPVIWHYGGDGAAKANLKYLAAIEAAKMDKTINNVELLRVERQWSR